MRSSSNSASPRPATPSTACAAASTGCAAIPRRWNGWRARTSAWCAGRTWGSSCRATPSRRRGYGVATADRLALAAALALLLALALYGSRVHWVEEAGTAERDGYVGQAQLLLSGSLPRDPYRPLLYPLLTAALSPLTGGAFAAARLLSNLAAAALAWLAYACGRRLAGAAAGGWGLAADAGE